MVGKPASGDAHFFVLAFQFTINFLHGQLPCGFFAFSFNQHAKLATLGTPYATTDGDCYIVGFNNRF